jgi:signal transduction histidine kinase
MSFLLSSSLDRPTWASPADSGVDGRAQRIVKAWSTVDQREKEIAIISHELRNSLAVVRNAAGLLRREGADRHVGQMTRHIEDLLDAAVLGRQKLALRLSFVNLRTILGNAVDAIAPDCAQRSHRLVVNLPAEALWVHADGARLEQVFSNLLINAAKCTPAAGEITVTLGIIGKNASVRIRDSGIGIAPAQLTRIFEMFVQVDATALQNEGGRGIGLAVVRDLVEMHGGTVVATSAGLNLGSEFTVLLPALPGQPAESPSI